MVFMTFPARRHPAMGGSREGTLAMADTDSAVEVRGSVATRAAANGHAAADTNDPDEIVARIERTRENLAQTIDTLADRVSPAGNARRLRERAMEQRDRALQQVARPEVRMAAVAAGLAVAGLVVLRIWSRRRK
jgi:hypothetical protein